MKKLLVPGLLLLCVAALFAQDAFKPFHYRKVITNTSFAPDEAYAESIYVHGVYENVIYPTFIHRGGADSIYIACEKDTSEAYLAAVLAPGDSYSPVNGVYARYFTAKSTGGTAALEILIAVRRR